jgi:hypothetical protein
MGKQTEDGFRGVKLVSRAPSKGQKPYKQRSDIEYQAEYFDLYEKELKTDLCWAIDTNNLDLLETAYKEARTRLGISKGRPTKITPDIQERRQEVKANFCLYLSNQFGESYSNVWETFFLRKNQPKKPQSNTSPEANVRFWCGKYPKEIKTHLNNVLDPDMGGREALAKLLENTDTK